jgi:hypothetical protein
MEIIEPNGIINFKNRYECANNLTMLYIMGPFNQDIVKVPFYPENNEWSDSCLNFIQTKYHIKNDPVIYRKLVCPGKFQLSDYNISNKFCNYAMNPNCNPDSPGDMVLLFETKDGWNQHGGPELFTFDNHDPKGGCVLFNDGSVKFIRTQEELNNLRWK